MIIRSPKIAQTLALLLLLFFAYTLSSCKTDAGIIYNYHNQTKVYIPSYTADWAQLPIYFFEKDSVLLSVAFSGDYTSSFLLYHDLQGKLIKKETIPCRLFGLDYNSCPTFCVTDSGTVFYSYKREPTAASIAGESDESSVIYEYDSVSGKIRKLRKYDERQHASFYGKSGNTLVIMTYEFNTGISEIKGIDVRTTQIVFEKKWKGFLHVKPSHDMSMLSVITDDSSRLEIYKIENNSLVQKERVKLNIDFSLDGGTQSWSPDDTKLAFIYPRYKGNGNFMIYNLQTGKMKEIEIEKRIGIDYFRSGKILFYDDDHIFIVIDYTTCYDYTISEDKITFLFNIVDEVRSIMHISNAIILEVAPILRLF